jgi:CheY-like chemotaxis protein
MVTQHPEAANPPFSVLIADDDRGTRDTLRDVLQDRGFRTVVAADGQEAVEIVRIEFVHLILCDFQMPRMTGLEAVQMIRQIRQLVPAILMTADATSEVLRQAFLAQVYSVIPKPLNKNVVLHTMDRALAQVYGHGADPNPPRPTPTPRTPTEETDR